MADENAISKNMTRLYAVSELPEILVAATLAFILIPVNKNWLAGVLIAFLLFLLSIVLKIVAGARERRALKTRLYQDGHVMHVVTAHRLKTIETVGAGADIIEVLKLRLDRGPMPAEELVRWLEEMLGRERVQETIEIVRRYTRMTEEVRSDIV